MVSSCIVVIIKNRIVHLNWLVNLFKLLKLINESTNTIIRSLLYWIPFPFYFPPWWYTYASHSYRFPGTMNPFIAGLNVVTVRFDSSMYLLSIIALLQQIEFSIHFVTIQRRHNIVLPLEIKNRINIHSVSLGA